MKLLTGGHQALTLSLANCFRCTTYYHSLSVNFFFPNIQPEKTRAQNSRLKAYDIRYIIAFLSVTFEISTAVVYTTIFSSNISHTHPSSLSSNSLFHTRTQFFSTDRFCVYVCPSPRGNVPFVCRVDLVYAASLRDTVS